MTQLRVGILGVGQRGLQHLGELWSFQKTGLIRVTALCDAWADNLSAPKIQSYIPEYHSEGVSLHTSFQEMVSEDIIDVLYICLPPGSHNGEVVVAARSGIHVFVEKPMSLYYDEAVEMEDAIKTSGVISTVGFQQRYDSRNVAVREFLKNRRIVLLSSTSHGSLENHSTKHTHTEEMGGPANRVWTANFAWSGSAVVEGGIHTVDLMRYWCGDIAWVQSVYVLRDEADIENDGDNPCVCVVNFGFLNGAVGTLHISKLRRVFHGSGDQIILWDHGHISFDSDGPVAHYYDGPYPPEQPPAPTETRHPVLAKAHNDPRGGINQVFINAIADNRPESIKSPFSQAMNSLAAVLAANLSHELEGERIELQRFAKDERYYSFRNK
ncbi:MAG: Gfo/Idh/MocA family oxidoreductase [Gemmatimonadota bacterium]|nr:Gfo/Idh/MocA family oxidoreductase [Gemmatimonadota bacterium]